MSPSIQQNVAALIIPSERCEQLYQARATSYQDQPLGTFSCLPCTDRAHSDGLDSWNSARDPWVMDRALTGQELRCLLWIDPQLEYFSGHFPGQPILPGVVQLEWSLTLAPWTQAAFTGLQNLKFKLPVQPAEILQLVLSHQPGKIHFVFSSPTQVRSQGTLLYRV